jgi:hypothetical protein
MVPSLAMVLQASEIGSICGIPSHVLLPVGSKVAESSSEKKGCANVIFRSYVELLEGKLCHQKTERYPDAIF